MRKLAIHKQYFNDGEMAFQDALKIVSLILSVFSELMQFMHGVAQRTTGGMHVTLGSSEQL